MQTQAKNPPTAESLAIADIISEFEQTTEKFGPFNSAHEGFAVLKEEVDELWQEVKHGTNPNDMRMEAVQVGAMALRFLVDTCKSAPSEPIIGAPYEGGFFAGQFFDEDGTPCALIVAPKAEGETKLEFNANVDADPQARSMRDGLANSNAINDDDHPAAKFCRDLRIGGHDDWYLPSRNEAALLAENLFPGTGITPAQTSAEAFKEGGTEAFEQQAYWTSTERSDGCAWVQGFGYGYQGSNTKGWSLRVRAVRKCPLHPLTNSPTA